MKFCKQLFQDDCGFACFKMLLAYYKKDNSFINLPNPKLQGKYSFLDLVNLGRKYGVELEGYKVNDISLIKKHMPLIVELSSNGCNHFCILYKIKGKKFYIYDPCKGKLQLEYNLFIKRFLNNVLIFKKELINKKIRIKNKINNLFLCYVSFISIINFACAFLIFFNKKIEASNFIGSLLYICLIFIVNKISLSFFDLIYEKKINEKIIINEKINLNHFMNDIYMIKQNLFQNISSLIGNITILIFIFIICVINNRFTLFCFLILCVLNLIKFKVKDKFSFSKIEYFEIELKNSNCNRKENYNRLNKNLNLIKCKITFIDSLLIIFIFTFIICLQLIDKTFVINHALFYFFCLNLFSEKFYEILTFINIKEEIQKDMCKVNTFLEYH